MKNSYSEKSKYYFAIDMIAPDGTKKAQLFTKYGSFNALKEAMDTYKRIEQEEPELLKERDSVRDIGYKVSPLFIVKETVTSSTTTEVVFGAVEEKPKFKIWDKVLIIKSSLLLENQYAGFVGTIVDYNIFMKNYSIEFSGGKTVDIREYWNALELMTEDKYLTKEELRKIFITLADLKEKEDISEIFKILEGMEFYKYTQLKGFFYSEEIDRNFETSQHTNISDKLFKELKSLVIYGK